MTIRAVLVDDEFYALQHLKIQLLEIGGVDVVGMYDDVNEFLDEVCKLCPDVVFLDVEMPGMNGFSVLSRIMEMGLSPEVIFVTAFGQYAVKAFEIDATDYIVKPLDKERLKLALSRVDLPSEGIRKPAPEAELKIDCFRTFSVTSGAADLSAGWKRNKAEELLAYLICEKGKFVSKERLAEDLWPEADGEKTQANLHVAYYYLKQQEKSKGVTLPLESQRGKLRLRMEGAQCDLTQFDTLRDQSIDRTLTPGEQLQLLEQAEELYAGDLLADKFYSWAVPLQQRYRIQYEEILQRLTELHRVCGNERKANYYQEKLEQLDR